MYIYICVWVCTVCIYVVHVVCKILVDVVYHWSDQVAISLKGYLVFLDHKERERERERVRKTIYNEGRLFHRAEKWEPGTEGVSTYDGLFPEARSNVVLPYPPLFGRGYVGGLYNMYIWIYIYCINK